MNFYILATKAITRYAHRDGQLYPLGSSPSGAYPLTEPEYNRFNYYIAKGGALQWYANQRPYISLPWVQPIFTNSYLASDGSRIKASSEGIPWSNQAYKAMDGNMNQESDGYYWTTNNSSTGWWRIDFPYQIALSSLIHYNRYNADYASISGQYFTDETKTTPIGAAFSLDGSWTSTVPYNDTENPIMTHGIYFQKTGGNPNSGIGELVLAATAMTYEAGDGR